MLGVLLEALDARLRHVLDRLQLAGLEAGHPRARLGHDPEGHGIEAGELVAAEAGPVLVLPRWGRSPRSA